MTSPSVVILTEPANCDLADRQLLLRALLEAQELSREGVPIFQAFCDNPAAAETFINAYATAYPILQLQSPDLPLPEQLYSMMVDGGLTPLRNLEPSQDSTRLEGETKLHPLLVLSLGTPDAVMHALQGNRFMKSGINVVEIAPVEEPRSAAIPVAAAVAAHVAAGPSWTPDTSSSPDEEGALAPSDEAVDAPLKLDSAELNLEKISIDDHGEQAQRSPPAAAMTDTRAGVSTDAGVTRTVEADAQVAESGNAPSQASESGPGPVTEAHSTAAPAPISVSSATPESTAVTSAEPESVVVSDRSSSQAEPSSTASVTPSTPPPEVGAETPPRASAGNDEDPSQTAAENAPGDSLPKDARTSDGAGDNAASPAGSTADGDTTEPAEDLVYNGSSFSEPGDDVVYSPTGSFTSDDDTPYPLPFAAASEVDDFGGMLRASMADDIVDLEGISYDGADHPKLTVEPFDPILMRVGGPDGLGAQDPCDASRQNADPGHLDTPTPDPDNHPDEAITSAHDLDI